jgi:nucleoside-triphosphatase THEP1/energy-coupling factor transporter transmembrane protein EcfT
MNRAAALLLGVAAVVVLFGQPVYALWAALVALAATWVLDPPAVRAGLRFGVVLAIVFAASVTAAVVAWAAGPEKGIAVGGMVLLRLLVLTAAGAVIVRNVDVEWILQMTARAGLERLGLVFGLALNTLPHLVEVAGDVWTAHVVRNRKPYDQMRRLPGLGVVLLAHTARIADDAAAAASLRGHAALTRQGAVLRTAVRTVVVTGPPNGGKTAAVVRLAAALLDRGLSVAGFAQIGVIENGAKVGFRVREFESGVEAQLARVAGREDGDFGTRFVFSSEGFDLGRRALGRAAPGGVVIVDELGPVELRGDGHMPAVERAMSLPGLAGAVIVVRRSLVPSLLATLDATDAVVLDIDDLGDSATEAILEALAL